MIPYGRQSVSQDDIDAVVDVLKSDYLTQGGMVPAFEQAVCQYTGAAHGVAVNSGTSALHIACLALGLKEHDYLWTTPITFVASANCGLYCGARVDFVDINKDSWNIDTDELEKKLVAAEAEGKLPKILVVVHFAGLPADLKEISRLSRQYGFRVIEDACHALGAIYQEQPVGNSHYSDISVFSFHPVKSITCGEGGMAVTNDDDLANKMRLLASHCITRDAGLMNKEPEGDWYYQQIDLGYNYRLSDIHAALGMSQLNRLDEFIQKREAVASVYDKAFEELPLQLPVRVENTQSACHLYVVVLEDEVRLNRKQVFDELRARGIGINVHYIPVHLQPYYQGYGFKKGDFPVAEAYYGRAISLPCFPMLTDVEQQQVINAVSEVVV